MPAEKAQAARTVEDFAGLLAQLGEEGIPFAVIGGCAVAAYAHLRGEAVTSVDLDIYLSQQALQDFLSWAPHHGIQVVKRPRPRHLKVAVLEWDGKEVNALSETSGLPAPDVVARTAREIVLSRHGDVVVPIADPFDLLANKLAVNREKDRPHVEILLRFLEEEVVEAFVEEEKPRQRIAPAARLLDVLGQPALSRRLAERLLPLARLPADFRFLLSRAPDQGFAEEVLSRAPEDRALRAELEEILSRRRF